MHMYMYVYMFVCVDMSLYLATSMNHFHHIHTLNIYFLFTRRYQAALYGRWLVSGVCVCFYINTMHVLDRRYKAQMQS